MAESGDINGFRDVAIAPGRAHFEVVALHGVRRKGDDDDVPVSGVGFDETCKFQAIQAGHLNVHEDHIGPRLFDAHQRFLCIPGDIHVSRRGRQYVNDQFHVQRIVVDDQYSR